LTLNQGHVTVLNMSAKKLTVIIPTAVKLDGIGLTEEFLDYKKTIDKIQRELSVVIESWFVSGKISEITSQYINFTEDMWDANFPTAKKPEKLRKDSASLRHLKMIPEVKELIEANTDAGKELNSSAIDDVLWHVVERYKSFVNRNSTKKVKKFPKNGIKIKENKAMNFKDGKVKILTENKSIEIKTIYKGYSVFLNYDSAKYKNDSLVNDLWRGGNLVFNSLHKAADNELVLLHKEEREMDSFDHVIGLDVNQKNENWIAFSEEMENGKKILPKPEYIQELETKRDDYNRKLRPPKGHVPTYKLNSAQRRKMYNRLHRVFALRLNAIKDVLIPTLEYFKTKYNSEFCLAIDGVASGATSGSFGQEDIRDEAVRWCVNNEVPFVVVPPQYTSQKCPECGAFHKQERTVNNFFFCKTCGYSNANCDELAALNIKEHGKFLIDEVGISSTALSMKHEKKMLVQLYSVALREHYNFPSKK